MTDEMQTGLGRDAPQNGREEANAPDLGSLLGSLLGGTGGGTGASESAIPSDAMREGIGAVLSDPQMMAKLPDMIEMLRPLMGGGAGGGNPLGEVLSAVAKPQEKEREGEPHGAAASPVSVQHGDRKKGCHDRRIALLCALRPYLSPRRQEAIDYILRMDKMGKLFRNG